MRIISNPREYINKDATRWRKASKTYKYNGIRVKFNKLISLQPILSGEAPLKEGGQGMSD